MSSPEQTSEGARFNVENIGGISETDITISPGVTILTGKNATNRTSFLQAIMAVMGSDRATLKADAQEGSVRLALGGDTYERTLQRDGKSIKTTGDVYLEAPDVADLFSFLLEDNEARRAIADGDDLRELIMRPVDVEAIEREIDRLDQKKGRIADEISSIESRQRDLPDLETRRNSLRQRIADKHDELAAKEEEIEQHSHDIEESRQNKDEFENTLAELSSTRSDLESVRRRIESQKESIASLKQERTDLTDTLEDLPDAPMGDQQQLEARIERLRTERQRLNTELSDLQSLIEYNEERLETQDSDLAGMLADGTDVDNADSLTDQLLDDDEESVVCWTCGSTVEREQIEETIARLRESRTRKVTQLEETKSELEELKRKQRTLEQKRTEREETKRRIDQLETEIERRNEQLASLKDRRSELTTEVNTLEDEVESFDSDDFDGILSLHKEANQIEFEIDSLESDLEAVTDEIESIEELLADLDGLRVERERVVEELTENRTKIDDIEAEAVEKFNEHMEAILDILAYENLEQIWIERAEQTVRDGRRAVDRTAFELHIVRATENGAAYEDTVDHLSESELEVLGLIFALAGYLVHDLHETVPFMLLDSLEAIDNDRIATLVTYFSEYAKYLVVTLLPEDAQALDDEYTRITSI